MYTDIPILFAKTISVPIYILNIFLKKYDEFQKFFLMYEISCRVGRKRKGAQKIKSEKSDFFDSNADLGTTLKTTLEC